jgi:subtilisin family serine protease
MRRIAVIGLAIFAGACSESSVPSAPVPGTAAPAVSLATAQAGSAKTTYIVVFKNDLQDVDGEVTKLTGKYAGNLKHAYKAALKGMALELSDAGVAALRTEPSVAYVEADQPASISVDQSGATWGLDRIDQRALPLDGVYSYANNGAGVTVYIIDTGMNFAHVEFGARASSGYDAVDGGSADDCNGHGTHVAGTVGGTTYGVAKGVTLKAVRVLDCGGSGSYAGVIAGIDWVTSNRVLPAVANMSLGGGLSSALNQAVTNSVNAGVTYAIAAGNSNADACNYSPSSTPAAITVGATTIGDAKASFSNYGSCVDLNAPGVSITSAWYSSNSATNTISGTSMASPHVAGGAALYLGANPSATPAQVGSALTGSATAGVVTGLPAGTANLLLFTGTAGPPPPPPPPPSGVVASFTYSCNNNLSCSFDASSSANATSYAWTFGDGGTGSGVTVTHAFAAKKNYTVTLTATGAAGSNSTSQVVSCNPRRCN